MLWRKRQKVYRDCVRVRRCSFSVAGLYLAKSIFEKKRLSVKIVRYFPFTRENSLKSEGKEASRQGHVQGRGAG